MAAQADVMLALTRSQGRRDAPPYIGSRRALAPLSLSSIGPSSPTASTRLALSRRSAAKADVIDQTNSEIVERINASGRAYLTQTKLRGRTVMRIGFGNVLTTEEHLRAAWELIQSVSNDVCD